MTDGPRIALIPRVPEDMVLDFMFKTDKGIAVRVSDEKIQALQERGIPVAVLFDSGNEYAGAMANLSRGEAMAAIEPVQDAALAALSPQERDEFGVA